MRLSRRNQPKKSSRYEYQTFHLIMILLISFTILFNVFLRNQSVFNDSPYDTVTTSPLKGNSKEESLENTKHLPSLDIHSSKNPRILFILADPTSLDLSYDKPFVDFINKTLGFNIILHDDNNSYNYAGYDAVVISDSIAVDQVSSLVNESIPILIMESFVYTDFRLASGRGDGFGTDLYIMNSSHYITTNETIDTFTTVYSSGGSIQFVKGYTGEPSWSEIDSLARRTLQHGNERTIITLDKGNKDWNNLSAPERRMFWGATRGDILNQKGWELWNRTLRWILYDDINGSATINVNVIDLDNQNVPNAEVNLTHSIDLTQRYSQNTTVAGLTTFIKIPYGSYNLTVEFEDSINDTLVFLNITGQQTFNLIADVDYIVRINEYIDNDPPSITNVGFFPSNRTFHANVSDSSTLVTVNLSLTATNTSFTRNQNFTMVTTNGILYYNESAAQDLTAVNVTYNITAIDIAGNIRISDNVSFLLGDITPPIIQEYNVTDYKNGTLEFYANITDKQSDVQDPVILRINHSYVQMHLNASGYWTYRTLAYYDLTLNYTVWSANDSIGNENGTRKFVLTPEFGLVSPKDTIMPHIWGVSDTFAVHEDGYVEFTSSVDDWNEFQSGTNITSIHLTLSVNGVNTSYIMTPIGATTYYYEFTFSYEDTVYYWVNASDLAENINPGSVHGPFIIDDNAKPIVSWWAEEWGNGTVDFHAEVTDWPNNETTAYVSYTQNWFDTPWPNTTMTEIAESQFSIRVHDVNFKLEDIWYYVTAIDASNNTYEPALDQSRNIIVTDKIPPVITFTVENSIMNDGEITVTAYAIDVFSLSNFVNNTFYINMTSDSTTIETTMNYNPILRNWFKTQSFPYGEEVDIIIGVHDDAGNFGTRKKTIVINDLAPPNINSHGSLVYQNGTITIWAEVVEGPFGSGLAEDNSSVTIEIIYRSSKNVTMNWNGSGNFYTYSISGFVPTDVPMYRIKAIDKNSNPNITEFIPVYIFDLTTPICYNYNLTEIPINHYASNFRFWVNASDPFGTLAGVNLTVNYYNVTHSWMKDFEMQYDGSLYFLVIQQVIRDRSFNYSFVIYDEAFNTLLVKNSTLQILNFRPTELRDHGIEFYEENIGKVCFWCETYDFFNDHNVTLTVFDDTNGSSYESPMEFNGTHYVHSVSIDYLHYYSYTIEVIDSGVISGYYSPIQGSNSHQMQDPWRPVIEDPEISFDNGTVTVRVNITDWGSGVSNVTLFYQFVSDINEGGGGSQVFNTIMMENDSTQLFYSNLKFNETGILSWYIQAYDEGGFASTEVGSDSIAVTIYPPTSSSSPDLFLIIFIVITTAAFLIFLLLGGTTIQRRRSTKFNIMKEMEDKLSIISNVYTIIVSTEVGVPIYTLTNVMYRKGKTLSDSLSGLSVSIDTFLQSFQSDFMQQVQQDGEVSETEDGIIRISVIEQHQVQVLIAATPTFRIFVFLREQPSIFTKKVFSRAIQDLEKNISIQDLGIVDERFYGPKVELILNKYFPLTLLKPFFIDTFKLKMFDEGLKRGRVDIPISRAGLNSLKRLVIAHRFPESASHHPEKLFNEAVDKELLLESRMLLYNDAWSILAKLLKIPPEQIYEALWIGCSPDVQIITSQRV